MNESMEKLLDEFELHTYEEWKKAAEKALKGADFNKSMFTLTYEGITLKPIYNKEDIDQIESIRNSFPGLYPFNRHSEMAGYIKREWEIAQNIPYSIPEIFNKSIKNDLANGQNSIKIYLDKACVMYEDFENSDLSNYDLIVNDITDFAETFKDLDLYKYPINIYAGIASLPAFTGFFAFLKKSNYEISKLSGSINFDIFSDLILEGNLKFDINNFLDQIALITKWTEVNAPNFQTIYIDSSVFHNAGANSAQELAISISAGVFFLNAMIERGLNAEEISKRISFNYSIGTNFFMELAKLRAARILWAKVLTEYGIDSSNISINIKTETSLRDSTFYDPYVNMLRATSETFTAIVGGTNSHTVRNFDELHCIPNDFSRRVARNIQNVLKFESHLTDTIDPAGGSYYIESLTYELAKLAWEKFTVIENKGGILEVLKSGELQDEINDIANQRLKNVSSRKDTILGSNKYPNLKDKLITHELPFDSDDIDNEIEKFDSRLENRNFDKIDELLNQFENNFDYKNIGLIDTIIEAHLEGASLSEVFNSIPMEINETKIAPLIIRRTAEPFEQLRVNAEKYKIINETYPKLNFVCFGKLKEYKGRADFSSDFFLVGGFENRIIDNNFNAKEALAKIDSSKEDIYVICSTDDIYSQVVPEFASELRKMNDKNFIILAGYPKDKVEEYQNAGVDMFIHIKSNIVETLSKLQYIAGISKVN